MKKFIFTIASIFILLTGCIHCPYRSDEYKYDRLMQREALLSTISVASSQTTVLGELDWNGGGTGVILSNGFILTAKHVVDKNDDGIIQDYEKVVKVTNFSTEQECLADVAWVNTGTEWTDDFAFLKPREDLRKSLISIGVHAPAFGEKIYALGFAASELPLDIKAGLVGGTLNKCTETDMQVVPGDSGGPVFCEEHHELIGMMIRMNGWYVQAAGFRYRPLTISSIYLPINEVVKATKRGGASQFLR